MGHTNREKLSGSVSAACVKGLLLMKNKLTQVYVITSTPTNLLKIKEFCVMFCVAQNQAEVSWYVRIIQFIGFNLKRMTREGHF